MYKLDLVLNNLQWLICHEIKQNQNLKRKITYLIKWKITLSFQEQEKVKILVYSVIMGKWKTLQEYTVLNFQMNDYLDQYKEPNWIEQIFSHKMLYFSTVTHIGHAFLAGMNKIQHIALLREWLWKQFFY